MLNKVLDILNNRLHHLSIHNEENKDIRISEILILKGIFKDRLK